MLDKAIHERLRQKRLASGQDLSVLAKRIGVRLSNLQALEAGRYQDLPTGIYARHAVKSFATALQLDPDEVLESCEASLPGPEDPIAGLARLRGLPPPKAAAQSGVADRAPRAVGTSGAHRATRPSSDDSAGLSTWWRPLAAMAIDAAILSAGVVVLAALTSVVMRVPLPLMMRHAAPAFALMGALFGGLYFVLLGGIGDGTCGARWVGAVFVQPVTGPLAAEATFSRALQCVRGEVSCLVSLLDTRRSGQRSR